MFWGYILKEGQTLKSSDVINPKEYSVLHLSGAVLEKPNSKPTRVYVQNGKDAAEILIASLSEQKESTSLNLYINCAQHMTLSVKGPSEVHLSGYFEPKHDADDVDIDEELYG